MTVHAQARRIAERCLPQLQALTTADLRELAAFIDAVNDDFGPLSSRQALVAAITRQIHEPCSISVLFRFIAGVTKAQGQRPPRELYRLQAKRERPFHRPRVA